MRHEHHYESLRDTDGADVPSYPPNYNDLESNMNAGAAEAGEAGEAGVGGNRMMEFEIEDEIEEPRVREGFMVRTSLATRKFVANVQNRLVNPVTKFIDPMYEGYIYLNTQYEKSILRLGNPLVVKRLLYVFFILGVVFFISRSSINSSVNGATGGAFSQGKFYDIDVLSSSIDELVESNLMKQNLEYFSSMPHIAGSKGDLALAKYIQDYMVNDGINIVNLNELETFINYPSVSKKDTYLKLGDGSHEANLFEYNNESPEYVAFNADSLSIDKELEAPFIYVGFGDPDDFEKLISSNIHVKDSIVMMKYGGKSLESNKVLMAARYGAKGVVFITPKFKTGSGDTIFEQDSVIQSHDLALIRKSPGDISTPKWMPSERYSSKSPLHDADLAPKIPTIPISWKDGQAFLKKLDQRGVKLGDFFSGDQNSPSLKMRTKNFQRPLHRVWNVAGSIRGREQTEKGVIIGASRDSKCFGTLSTNSGSVVLLEMVKIFTMLQRRYNWSPSRSIYFVSFDASEYNVAGAHQWVQNRKDSLKKEGYAYIDLSDAVTGDNLIINSHPFFHDLIKDALKSVHSKDIEHRRKSDKADNLYEVYKKQNGDKDTMGNKFLETKNYIPFINMINTPSLEIKFSGSNVPQGSCFDNFENFEKSNIDKDMAKHGSLVVLLSKIVLQLAEMPIVPYNFVNLASSLLEYEKDLESFTKNELSESKSTLNFDELKNSLQAFKESSDMIYHWTENWKVFISESDGMEPSVLAMSRWKCNEAMIDFNGIFVDESLGRVRPGYLNHLLGIPMQAPVAPDDDYEWNTFPIVRDFIIQNKLPEAQNALNSLSRRFKDASNLFYGY